MPNRPLCVEGRHGRKSAKNQEGEWCVVAKKVSVNDDHRKQMGENPQWGTGRLSTLFLSLRRKSFLLKLPRADETYGAD